MPDLKDEDYIINVGPHSTFRRSGTYQTLPEHIDAIFSGYETSNERRICIYFHGGLVNEAAGLAGARDMAPHIKAGNHAPICFVWETGLFETIGTNLSKINQTKLFNKLLKALLKKISERITISDPFGRGTATYGLTEEEIQIELEKPHPFSEFKKVGTASGGRGPSDTEELAGMQIILESEIRDELRPIIENDSEFIDAIAKTNLSVSSDNDTTARSSRGIISVLALVTHAAKIVYRIIKRYVEKRDHGFYSTVVEEILREFYVAELGAWVWKSMKEKANEMWKDNTGLQGLERHVGRYFLDKLIEYKVKYPDTQISLIGHSAGSIAICHLLKNAAASAAPFTWHHLILMAPACRVELFKQEALATPNRFNDIRIFTMDDGYECKDTLVPYVYTRSLLYLVSGILEDEGKACDAYILGLERHIGYVAPYRIEDLRECHEYIYATGLNRVSFSVATSTTAGMGTAARKHGDFDNDPATLRSIEAILNQ